MNLKRIIIIILILILIALLLYLILLRPKESPISILNSHGQEVNKLNVLDEVSIRVKNLKPSTHYNIYVNRSDGEEISHSYLTTDRNGNIPFTHIWYDAGVEYKEGSRVGELNIEEVLKYKYKVTIAGMKEKYASRFNIVDPGNRTQIYSADENGNPLNSFIVGEQDVYAVGRNFPPNSSIRIFVVDYKYSWNDGDELTDVSGGYEIVNLNNNHTGFKKLIWTKDSVRIGSYDIIADYDPQDGYYSETNTDPIDNDGSVGFCGQGPPGTNHIEDKVTCQAPDPPPPSAPNPIYKENFSLGEEVWAAVNPYAQGLNYAGMNARIYVVNHKVESDWTHGITLTDVSGGFETTTIQPGCANVNYTLIWPNPQSSGKYDVVVDFAPFGVYDKGTDIVDMLDPVGLLIGNTDIEVVRLKFNWGSASEAANLIDHITNSAVAVPEWDKTISRNEPASYKKGSTITVQAQFQKILSSVPNSVVIWAEAGKGVSLSPQTVTFSGTGNSSYVNFTATNALSNYINKYNFVWQWYYAISPYPGSVQNPINVSSHTICTTYDTPIVDPAYKKTMLWTSEWAKYRSTQKSICDAIINKLDQSGLKYGISGWQIDDMLDNGGGMCGGWRKMFAHMAGCQGVLVHQKCYILKNDAGQSPEVKWNAIVIKDGGLNQPHPTQSAIDHYDIDNVYPNPASTDITVRNEHRYRFWAPNDGHCINFLEYQGNIYLYDPSFGNGPFSNTYTSIPSGTHTGTDLTNFRANYHDNAIDYMLGNIKKNDNTYQNLTIKTTLIPDLRNPSNSSTFEIHYDWY